MVVFGWYGVGGDEVGDRTDDEVGDRTDDEVGEGDIAVFEFTGNTVFGFTALVTGDESVRR